MRSELRYLVSALVTAALVGCGPEEPAGLPWFDPVYDSEYQGPRSHPDKSEIGAAPHCQNWQSSIAAELEFPAPWGLPSEGVVSINVRGFFAGQHRIDGLIYYPCALADIFAEIELHAEVLRTAYFALPPEDQLARSEVATFLSFLYEEPSVLQLLLDIAIQPMPDFDPAYVVEESIVRISATSAISDTAPIDEEARPWIDALYQVVEECPDSGARWIASLELRGMGESKSDFTSRMQGKISDEELSYYLGYWP